MNTPSNDEPSPDRVSEMRLWWRRCLPIWIGTAAGAVLAAILFVIGWINASEDAIVYAGTQSRSGWRMSEYSTGSLLCLMPMFGFFFGLMAVLWLRTRR